MLKFLLIFKDAYTWFKDYMSVDELRQMLLYILMAVALFYITSNIGGMVGIVGQGLALLYAGYIIFTKVIVKILDSFPPKNEDEIKDK